MIKKIIFYASIAILIIVNTIVDININKNPSNKNYTLIHYFKNEEGLQKDINLLTQGLKNSRLKGDKNENLQIKKDTV